MIRLMVVLLISFSMYVLCFYFSSLGRRSYFREWVENLGIELCCIASGK